MENQHLICGCNGGTEFGVWAGPYNTPTQRDLEARKLVLCGIIPDDGSCVPFKLDIVDGKVSVSSFPNTLFDPDEDEVPTPEDHHEDDL